MSVLIKGMEMPKSCVACRFSDWSRSHQTACCKLNGYEPCFGDHSIGYRINRGDDCPLIEVPPHGRLIDADKAIESMDYVCDAGGWLQPVTQAVNVYVKKHIDAQETVLEAEGEENE